MKTCPACGLEFADRYIFCTEDGSRLIAAGQDAADRESKESLDIHQAMPPVLFCPACAMEYPLTFVTCPADGASLKRLKRVPIGVASTLRDEAPPIDTNGNGDVDPLEPARQEQVVQPSLSHAPVSRDTSELGFVESNPRPAPRKIILTPEVEDAILKRAEPVDSGSLGGRRNKSSNSLFGYIDSNNSQQARAPERRGFRLAAAAIAAGLAVFALASLYTFSANARRKPPVIQNEIARQSDVKAEEPLFIPTPQAALEYKEPEPEPVSTNEDDQPAAEHDERASGIDKPSAAVTKEKPGLQMTSEPPPARKPQDTRSEPVQPPITKASHLPDTPLPRSSDGRINSNLVRVRARKTATGFRYDLTFTLQEMTGRAMYLDRLSIATQAASGQRHSEVIPFSHRLGGAGMMTFTVSVEMPGASESDWRGRIVCTGTGYDDQRRVTRIVFGANVTP